MNSLERILLKKARKTLSKSRNDIITVKEFNINVGRSLRFDSHESKSILKNLILRGDAEYVGDGKIKINRKRLNKYFLV